MTEPARPLLAGQTALVTGASSGIGAACAIALAAAGAKVGVNYRSDPISAGENVTKIKQMGSDAVALSADVSDESQVLAMFARFIEAFGRLDILIANAGLQQDAAV